MVVVNLDSGKIYQVRGQNERGAYLERLFDGYAVVVSGATLQTKYRELNETELTKVRELAPSYAAFGKVMTLSSLSGEPPPSESGPAVEGATPRQGAREGSQEIEGPQIGTLVEPSERDSFDRIIVHKDVKESIEMGLYLIENRAKLDEEWGLNEISPMKGKCIMNFVGPPGTGKTASAKALAKKLGKKLYQVDYSQIISKWVGDTGKHIKAAFAAAKQHDAVLFFDEADSLMSKRLAMPEDGVSNSVNQNRNILMQELDKYDGIMLTATNFFVNYDEALLRRISQHVHFELPNKEMRRSIFDLHIPALTKSKFAPDVNLDAIAEASEKFSGGDILVVCENAIKSAAVGGSGVFTQDHIMKEIEKVKKNKNVHGQGKTGMRKQMGVMADIS